MSTLLEIKPVRPLRVMDLVSEAGIDVSDWANYKRGAANAAANPKYCYSWAFVQPPTPAVLMLWYDTMREHDGTIVKTVNMRKLAADWDGKPGKGVLATRARQMDRAIEGACRDGLPVRVIICDRDSAETDGSKAVRVQRRLLDRVTWAVTAYNARTGACMLTRGASPEPYADQFSSEAAKPPARNAREVDVFVRSPEVRRNVLFWAKGRCEWCGKPGFIMGDGRVYLETHHVIPLAEGGPDTESNVAALCPNHHSEAHHGAKRADLRRTLLQRIARRCQMHIQN